MIVGFPGETEADLETLCQFLVDARMDVTGVFGYSDEDGTEAASYDGKLDDDEIRARTAHVVGLVEELNAQRAEERIGETVEVLVESSADGEVVGRAAHQGPEVDGSTYLARQCRRRRRPGPGRGGGHRRGGPPRRGAPVTGAVSPGSNCNVPNALTTLRIVMVPFFGWALLHDGGDSVTWRLVAFALFAAAMITDKIDGDLARKHDLVTNFGKIADPIADKAITGMALIALSVVGDVWWWVTIVVLLREWSVTLLRLSVLRQVVIAASNSGKLKTTLQAVALGVPDAAAAPRRRPRRRLRPLRQSSARWCSTPVRWPWRAPWR